MIEATDLARNSPTQQKFVAVVIQAKPGRKTQSPSARQIPAGNRSQIMGGVAQSEAVAAAQSAVHFRPENKILTAEISAFRGPFKGHGAACRPSGSKSPRVH